LFWFIIVVFDAFPFPILTPSYVTKNYQVAQRVAEYFQIDLNQTILASAKCSKRAQRSSQWGEKNGTGAKRHPAKSSSGVKVVEESATALIGLGEAMDGVEDEVELSVVASRGSGARSSGVEEGGSAQDKATNKLMAVANPFDPYSPNKKAQRKRGSERR
jgi:hypothetical protein